MTKYISVTLYKGDYISMMNLSEKHVMFYLECEEGNLTLPEIGNGFILKLVSGNLPNTIKAIPVDIIGGPIKWGMFGGYFIYTGDGRFSKMCRKIVGLDAHFSYPVPLHDRFE